MDVVVKLKHSSLRFHRFLIHIRNVHNVLIIHRTTHSLDLLVAPTRITVQFSYFTASFYATTATTGWEMGRGKSKKHVPNERMNAC